jgi:hypothetical protein
MLVCSLSLTLDDVLCQDDIGHPDNQVAKAVFESINESIYAAPEAGTKGPTKYWVVEQCFGEPCIVNASPERNCYAVYSDELKLKINRIESEQHGLMLVEQAMRKHGYFPSIVSCDRDGYCYSLSIPKNILDASDDELQAMIDKAEGNDNA